MRFSLKLKIRFSSICSWEFVDNVVHVASKIRVKTNVRYEKKYR